VRSLKFNTLRATSRRSSREQKAREITGAIGFSHFVPLADAKAADSLGQLTVPTAKTDLLVGRLKILSQ